MEPSLALPSPKTPKKRVRWQFYLAALLGVLFLVYFFQPSVTTWWVRRQLTARALDSGATIKFAKIEADFFMGHALLEGVQINEIQHPTNQIQSADIQVDFSPWRFLFRKELSPIQKIALGKTQIDWKWKPEKADKSTVASGKSGKSTAPSVMRNRFPQSLIGNGISANLECGTAKFTIANADFNFIPNAAGEIDIPHLTASLDPWKRSFNNLEGTTAIKDRAFYIGGLKLTPDLVLERGALDFTLPSRQKITSDLLFTAFGGQWRTDLDLDRRKRPLEITAAASFWNLSVKQLGEFVGNDDLAEGTIHEGRLTFDGNPAEPTRSNTTLRLNATDFRWHERRWNSLITSALLVNRRIDIPQFDLVQDKNQIQLKGSAALPDKWTQLPAEFQFQVLAQIDDLRSAALLILPDQKNLEGEAFFAGEVRNQKGKFSGNLKMRGGPLQIQGVAVDRVRGDLKLQGSEVSASALEFARRDDKATGWATLNLDNPRRYSGEFEVTANDIADYAKILPRAIADHAAAGGVRLWWSGDGTNHAHSGAFKINLQDFLTSREANTVPLDIISHGSYSPAGITLNHLTLQRPNTKLDTALVVRPDSLELRDLRITGTGGATISGNITLPINLFAALNNPTLASLLDSKGAATGQISGSKIRLDELSELAGRHLPIRGRATFDLAADGPLESLEAKLNLGLDDFFAPENLVIPSLKVGLTLSKNQFTLQSEINPKENSVTFQITGQTALSQARLTQGQWLDAAAPLSGNLVAKRLAVPLLHPWWPTARAFEGDVGGNLTLSGTAQAPVFAGEITLLNTDWQPAWLNYPLQKLNGSLTLAQNRLTSEKITGNYRGGSFTVSGTSGLLPDENLDLTIEGKSLTLSTTDDPSEAVATGTVQLQGNAAERSLQGKIALQSAIIHRELTLTTPPIDLPAIHRFSLPWVAPEWKIDLEISAAQPIEIRGKENTWLAEPTLLFRDTAGVPSLTGQLKLRPAALSQNPTLENSETQFSFQNTPLEEGLENNAVALPASDISLPVSPDATPLPPAEPVAPRRLEILPLAPTQKTP